ncbi:TetR/AcrR family transcriptional regulator; helix-turn-helix transcriptional regulator [Streptomyces sp. R1]|uniref:TetR/AcrR family transcriptional regulator n=1 Tax=unclassified Streptomyces TaxID=2593676 RepID=UPI00052A93EA|nr:MULTISPECIES: TetR/AcrR family transcriptional regulator [unclassified Streptomyces]AIV35204.1 TetR family transcriptional regulator [Streptomyces sp. CCM_MD2014]MCC8335111.1 TetR/AcrR family transcriptional regulator; helix-turn-helix transcriptional regulator [Streptomyces sp. R1]MDA4886920.1 TetR family transcriptional regulator [Streptomyces sp. MS2A]MYS49286.1 TetR family transcriptional regulator [Streptomyces sp. SID6013]
MTTATTPPRRQGRGGRERILAAAADLFAAQGINATGMEQIAERAPVSKRTLYAHFRTKDDLVLAHLEDLASSGRTLEGVLARGDVPARERILALFDPLPAGSDPVRGCPFIDAAVEFPDPRNAVHSYARERKLLMVRLVTELVAELGCRRPADLAEQLVTLADGAASRAMVLGEADYGRHARKAAEVLLDDALPATD